MREIEHAKPKNSKSLIRLLNYYNQNERNKEIPDPWGVSLLHFFLVFNIEPKRLGVTDNKSNF